MQFRIDIQSNDAGWQVQIFDSTTNTPILQSPRQLLRLGYGLQAIPLPPEEELTALSGACSHLYELCKDLCITTNENIVNDVNDIQTKIINRNPGRKDMQKFGSYLFIVLLGQTAWEEIRTRAGNQLVELALTWNDDQVINRLPWEMMHGPEGFLAEIPVAITRRVAGTTHTPGVITSQPSILCVIGTELGMDVIRPGAEYLGLLRTLQQAGLELKTHLLMKANIKKLEAAIKWFRPTIVHFICHGVFDGETSYLELMSDQANSNEPVPVRSANLLQALRPEPDMPLPTIVILSACSTANTEPIPQEAGQIASPLAVELVRGGIPIVVGMAGEVSDQACRLFSRRFFEALLHKWDIPYAVAEGRRGGIISQSGSDPKTSVDWALPTLFLSAGMKEGKIELPRMQQNLYTIAEEYSNGAYPAFCDRLELLEWYDILMADEDIQRKMISQSIQVLAVAVDEPTGPGPELQPKYGRTWLLREMAAHAVLDGHIPCILTTKEMHGQYWPATLHKLLIAIQSSANLFTAPRFGVDNPPEWEYTELISTQKQGDPLPCSLPNELKTVYNNVERNPADPLFIATAFCLDLLKFLDAVCSNREKQERDKARLLLLIDDVHNMSEAASGLLNHLCRDGLRRLSLARDKIRVVFTYSTIATMGDGQAVKAIDTWLQESKWAQRKTLTAFGTPTKFELPLEARLAYQQFLLNLRVGNRLDGEKMGLVPMNQDEMLTETLFLIMHNEIQGIPDRLTSSTVFERIKSFQELVKKRRGYELLRRANDDDVLRSSVHMGVM